MTDKRVEIVKMSKLMKELGIDLHFCLRHFAEYSEEEIKALRDKITEIEKMICDMVNKID